MTSTLVTSLVNGFNKYSKRNLVTFKKDFVYDRYSYQDIHNLSLKFITLLKENKIKKGDRIAICSYNCPQYFYVFLGSIFHGSILVPIDYGSSPELIKKFMKKTDCKLIITSRFKFVNVKTKKLFVEDLPELLINKKQGKINPDTKDDDLCQILFTSGTTGSPKGVMTTHNNIYSNITAILKVIKVDENYRLMSLLPLSHIFEQVAGFLILIITGAQTVQLKSRRPSEIVKVFQKEKINCLATVPAFLNLFKKKIEDKAKDKGQYKKLQKILTIAKKLPIPIRRLIFKKIHKTLGGNLKRIVCGAAPLSKETELFWESIGVMIIQAYGLTEASPVLTISDEKHRRITAVGQPIPGVRIKLSEKNEILALGENITQGYYKNPVATNNLFDKGWLKTGDIGEFDSDGYLYIKGRLKNMILKPSGLNVYPEDIEKIIDKHEDINESCVLGIEIGNDVVITAVLLLKHKISEKKVKKLISNVNKELEFHQKIQDRIIWRKQDFSRTLTLKVKRHEVLKEIENKTHIHTESKDMLIHLLSELSHVDSNDIKNNSNLYSELGFDSLKTIELAASVEERLGVEIDEYMIDAKTTVKKLRALIGKGKDYSKLMKLDKKMFSPLLKPVKILWSEIAFKLASLWFTEFKSEGLENIRNIKGQVIIAPNHLSHLDSPTIMKHLPLRIKTNIAAGAAADYFFAGKNIKQKLTSKFYSYILGAFPMSRDKDIKNRTSIRQSFEFVGEIVDRGWSIALAPEGTRSRTGKMGSFKTGIGVIIKETRLPCIPVKLTGLWNILPPGTNFPKQRGPASIKFGKPMYFSDKLTPVEITQELEKTIRDM